MSERGFTEAELAQLEANQERARGTRPTSHFGPSNEAPKPEALIEAECVKFLQEDGWRALKTNPVSDRGRGKGFGTPGMADYEFTRAASSETARKEGWCQILHVEFKSRGGKPQKHQIEWATQTRAQGFLVWMSSVNFSPSVEGFREFYAQSGLMKRSRWW